MVLGVTGSIAAFKAVSIASQLTQVGAVVDVIMTAAAMELVRPLSFQAMTHRPVHSEMFSLLAETEIGHVTLGQRADLVLIAPATANTLARLAHGISDDLLGTTVLATRAPIAVAPAMDANMYESPAVQANVGILRERGYTIIGPAQGRMASGLVGLGRMVEPDEIVERLRILRARNGDLAGLRVVVTAGGTREAIDPVRYVSNHSSGKMGYALAVAARDRGAQVTLITTPTALPIPVGVEARRVVSAADVLGAVEAAIEEADVLVMAAAVADFRPSSVADQKIKKTGAALSIELEPTIDVLAKTMQRGNPDLVRVGFAAESQDLIANAGDKLARKQLHMIVANNIAEEGSGFGTDTNRVTILHRDGGRRDLPLMSKREVAEEILTEAKRFLPRR